MARSWVNKISSPWDSHKTTTQPGDTLQMMGDLDGYSCYAGAVTSLIDDDGWLHSFFFQQKPRRM